MGWRLLPPFGPSRILPFSFRTSCCETTHASGYYHSWPRRVVLVSGSLTKPVSNPSPAFVPGAHTGQRDPVQTAEAAGPGA